MVEWKLSLDALSGYVRAFHEFDDGSGTVEGADLERLLRRVPRRWASARGRRCSPRTSSNRQRVARPREESAQASRVRTVRRVCECDMPPGEMRDRIEYGVRKAFPDIWEPIPDELAGRRERP